MSAQPLVPAYIEYGVQTDLGASTASELLAAKLRVPAGWEVQQAYRVDATVGFVEPESVPAWVGANAMLSPESSLRPTVVARGVIPLLYVFVSNGKNSFQLELSEVVSPLAETWKNSLLARVSLVPTAAGGADIAGFGFVIDLGTSLLRACYLPPLDDRSDSSARAAAAQEASSAFLAGLAA